MRRASSRRAGHEPANPALVEAFGSACSSGDRDRLAALLSEDVRVVVDSGGALAGTEIPAFGMREALDLIGAALRTPLCELEPRSINGTTGLLGRRDGAVVAAVLLDADDALIRDVWIVLGTDKLTHWNRAD